MVTAKVEETKLRLWVHNDSCTALDGTVEAELRDTAYGLLARVAVPVQVSPLSVQELDTVDFAQKLEGRGQDTVFVAYRLCEKNCTGAYASVLFCRPKQMELPRPSYTVRVENRGEAFDIYVKSNCYAHQVELETDLTDRPFSDNYFPLCTPQGVCVALEKNSVEPEVTVEAVPGKIPAKVYKPGFLSSMSVVKLRELARKLGVDNMTKSDIRFAKKQELIEKILDFQARQ